MNFPAVIKAKRFHFFSLDLTQYFSEIDGQSLSYTYVGDAYHVQWFEIDNIQQMMSGIPVPGGDYSYNITFSATDASGLTKTANKFLFMIEKDYPPQITTTVPPIVYCYEAVPCSFNVTSYITDPDEDPIDFSATTIFSPVNHSMSFSADMTSWSILVSQAEAVAAGYVIITFRARDPHYADGHTTETIAIQTVYFKYNRYPKLNAVVPLQITNAGYLFNYIVPNTIFIEEDGEPITITFT